MVVLLHFIWILFVYLKNILYTLWLYSIDIKIWNLFQTFKKVISFVENPFKMDFRYSITKCPQYTRYQFFWIIIKYNVGMLISSTSIFSVYYHVEYNEIPTEQFTTGIKRRQTRDINTQRYQYHLDIKDWCKSLKIFEDFF